MSRTLKPTPVNHFADSRKMVGITPLRACPRNGQGVRA